jgi:Tat protein secretion system quality control protein TatD with DNase activity
MIVDSHTHLNRTGDEPDFLLATKRLLAEADKNGIDKIVIIANTISGATCASTTEILNSIGDNNRFFVVGSPNTMDDRKNSLVYFEELLRNKKSLDSNYSLDTKHFIQQISDANRFTI